MADHAGLDRQMLYDVMAAGPLRSGMMDFVKAQAIDHEIMLAFSVTNAGKDVGYYAQMTKEMGKQSLMSPGTLKALDTAKSDGWGDRMVPEMVDYFESRFKD